jgi:sodium/hydrogen exchanger 10/11
MARLFFSSVAAVLVVAEIAIRHGVLAQTATRGWANGGPARDSCHSQHYGNFACFPLVDNFRETQPIGDRMVYRSPGATSACSPCNDADDHSNACLRKKTATDTKRPYESTTKLHWTYGDQAGWYHYRGSSERNECMPTNFDAQKRPGESPINIQPAETDVTSDVQVTLGDGFEGKRTSLTITNTGQGIKVLVCGSNSFDCTATVNLGQWPRKVRGLAVDASADEYYLSRIEFHWGNDDSKGSEHKVCGKPRSGEMHMVFANKRETDSDDRGTKYVILATLIEAVNGHSAHRMLGESGSSTSSALAHIFEDAKRYVKHGGESHASVDVNLKDLLPEDYATKFYSYAGSFTSPPCSMTATWIVFENYITVDKHDIAYLRKLRVATHAHAYTGLLFPFVGIFLGAITQYGLSRILETAVINKKNAEEDGKKSMGTFFFWAASQLPYTVAMLICGFALDRSLNALPSYNSLQQSVDMWAAIDGHLLLYAFLPALLFGDALAFDVHLFYHSKWQCLLLACPGVVMGTLMTASCAYYMLNWSWGLSLVFGSIMAATDPVAVVALLKAVGANPKLTMQITGESLLNDGTAIVLFNICTGIYGIGPEMTWPERAAYFFKMAVIGPVVGFGFGYLAYLCMRQARKHEEEDTMFQVAITVCTAYLSFFFAESEAGISGVLCTVCAALCLAKRAWPIISNHESMETCWHLIEFFGNTLIFLLAGIISSRVFSRSLTFQDVALVLVMYIMMVIIRAVMIGVFYYPLTQLGYGTNPKDAAFMVWAGLRGAVGLALAVYVADQAPVQEEGDTLIFYVSGLALCTLIFNGMTSEALLKAWNMVGIRGSRKEMLDSVKLRVVQNAEHVYHESCVEMKHDASEALAPLKHLGETLRHVLEEKEKDIEKLADDELDDMALQSTEEHVHHHHKEHAIARFYHVENLQKILEKLCPEGPTGLNEEKLHIYREEYYELVRAHYWEMIEGGHLPTRSVPGRASVRSLLWSIQLALDDVDMPIHDWDVLEPDIEKRGGFVEAFVLPFVDKLLPEWFTWDNIKQFQWEEERMETKFYILHGFLQATTHAQHNLTEFFGASEFLEKHPESPEEIQVLLEASVNLRNAKASMEKMSYGSSAFVHRTKSKIIAHTLLDEQHGFVCKLIKEGVLTQVAAKDIFADLEHDDRALDAEWNRQAKTRIKRQMTDDHGKLKRMTSSTIVHLASSGDLSGGRRRPSIFAAAFKPSGSDVYKKLREKGHLRAHKEMHLKNWKPHKAAPPPTPKSAVSPASPGPSARIAPLVNSLM